MRTVFGLFVTVSLLAGLVGCAGWERVKDAATTPQPALDGRTPLQVVVTNAPELAAAVASGNVAGATASGYDIWKAIGVVLTAAAGGVGVAYTHAKTTANATKEAAVTVASAPPSLQPAANRLA